MSPFSDSILTSATRFCACAADLMPLGTGIKVYLAMPARVQLKAILGILKGRNPQKVIAPAVVDPDIFGLTPLYRTMLDQVVSFPLFLSLTSPPPWALNHLLASWHACYSCHALQLSPEVVVPGPVACACYS